MEPFITDLVHLMITARKTGSYDYVKQSIGCLLPNLAGNGR